MTKIYVKNVHAKSLNEPFLNIFPKFRKEWVEYINRKITVEHIFDLSLGMGIRRVKFCADVYFARNPQPPRRDIEKLFHSDFSIDTFYPLFLESWGNINKWLVKTIWRENFGVNYDSQQSTSKRPSQNTKVYLPATLIYQKKEV